MHGLHVFCFAYNRPLTKQHKRRRASLMLERKVSIQLTVHLPPMLRSTYVAWAKRAAAKHEALLNASTSDRAHDGSQLNC